MKKLLLLIFTISLLSHKAHSQVDENPIEKIAYKVLQNEMFSNRFLKNFVFIKTNFFKKKALSDMDKSIAKFDDNLSFIILHLPYDKEVKEAYIKLQNYWNIYRIALTNYENENYESLIIKTKKFNKLLANLSKSVIHKHHQYEKKKKLFEKIPYLVNSVKMVDNFAIAYVLKNSLELENAYNYFDLSFSDGKKYLKKLGKDKAKGNIYISIISDLNMSLDGIKNIFEKNSYSPKMMYSESNNFSKLAFKLLDHLFNKAK